MSHLNSTCRLHSLIAQISLTGVARLPRSGHLRRGHHSVFFTHLLFPLEAGKWELQSWFLCPWTFLWVLLMGSFGRKLETGHWMRSRHVDPGAFPEWPSKQVAALRTKQPLSFWEPTQFLPLTPSCLETMTAILLLIWGSFTSCLLFLHCAYTFENSTSAN